MRNTVIDSFRIVTALYPPLVSVFSGTVERECHWWAGGAFFQMTGHSDFGGVLPIPPSSLPLTHIFFLAAVPLGKEEVSRAPSGSLNLVMPAVGSPGQALSRPLSEGPLKG